MATLATLQAWITYSNASITLGSIPPNAYFSSITLHVTEAFNAVSSNNISLGTDTSNKQVLGTNTACNTTGIKTVTLGTSIGYTGIARPIIIYYTQTGTAATTGKALVIVEYYLTPTSP